MRSFQPFPILKTPRVILRRIEAADRNAFFAMRSDPSMCDFVDAVPDQEIAETDAYLARMNAGVEGDRWIVWAIAERSSGQVVGSISIWNFDDDAASGELGYGLIPSARGRGYMAEALDAVVRYGLATLGLARIEAWTDERNDASIHLLRRSGFTEKERVDEPGAKVAQVFRMIVFVKNAER